jgi:hypothetical protein
MYDWALTEPVDVTLVSVNTDTAESVILVTRVNAPGAFVLTFGESRVLTNGVDVDFGEDMIEYCALADSVFPTMTEPVIGRTVRSDPEPEEY